MADETTLATRGPADVTSVPATPQKTDLDDGASHSSDPPELTTAF